MRTDWSKRWPDAEAMRNEDEDGVAHYPGWSMEVLAYLYEKRKVTASGHETTDTDFTSYKDDTTASSTNHPSEPNDPGDCSACHTAHGSPNRHLLNFQAVAELCFSCHNMVPGFHARFTLETQCTNCHSTIHGSFLSPFFLR